MSDILEGRPRNPNNSVALKLQQLTGRPVTSRRCLGASVLVLDRSESMDGPRLREAKRGGIEYVKSMLEKGFRVSVVAFSTEATIVDANATDLAATTAAIERLSAFGTTNVARALSVSRELLLQRGSGDQSVCIVSDGQPNDREQALAIAGEMKRLGIQILTIAVADADRQFLAELASTSSMALTTGDSGLRDTLTGAARLLLEAGGKSSDQH